MFYDFGCIDNIEWIGHVFSRNIIGNNVSMCKRLSIIAIIIVIIN